jgi:hypothetical protein
LKRLREGRKKAFFDHILRCARITGFVNLYDEFVIAKCEARRSRRKT